MRAVSVIFFVSAVIHRSGGVAESLMNPESSVICSSVALAEALVLVRPLSFSALAVDSAGAGLVLLHRCRCSLAVTELLVGLIICAF